MILYPASELEPGLTNLYLRVRSGAGREVAPLLGPTSGSTARIADNALVVEGHALGFDYAVTFRFAEHASAWFWQVTVANRGASLRDVDVVWTSDPALSTYGAVRTNEYYVSQYLDLTPVQTRSNGVAMAVRQNMPGERTPWLVLGCTGTGTGWATDALQLVDPSSGTLDLVEDLPDVRLQHEHTLAALGSEQASVDAGSTWTTGFFGRFVADHPAATGPDDAWWVDDTVALPEASLHVAVPAEIDAQPKTSAFSHPWLTGRDLTSDELDRHFGGKRDLEENGEHGVWAFRAGDEFVTLASKQRAVLRPHGHILRTGSSLVPESDVLTSTIWMDGGFASQVTQGHVSRGPVISGRRTYLGLQQAHGLRIFCDTGDGQLRLLASPSVWALRPDRARWIYALGDRTLEVTATAPTAEHRLTLRVVVEGPAVPRLVVAVHSALGGDVGQDPATPPVSHDGATTIVGDAKHSFTLRWQGSSPTIGGDALLFDDGVSRGLPWICATVPDAARFGVDITAETVAPDDRVESHVQLPDVWDTISQRLALASDGPLAGEVAALQSSLGWFTHNAFVHYLSPRGLEQYTGGGWGTRDVCQGPVGLLTAVAQYDALRAVLLQILRAQHTSGDWPQWFDFLPPIGPGQAESHGDVVYWPLLAVGDYLQATADASLLDEPIALTGDNGAGETVSALEHLRLAVTRIQVATVPGSPLPAYGHGDWNDSLQPADPSLPTLMASTWTSTLKIHALSHLAAGLRAVGLENDLVSICENEAAATRDAMRRVLMADGILSGYGIFQPGADVELLVHPRDTRTGLTYGVLPWIHAISGDQLTRDEAAQHLELLREHLWGPDGARLFDRPAAYRGGPMEVFKRAEAATFWGREIGLMYTHAHLRYAEALARFGDAPGLFEALRLVAPHQLSERVGVARPRQSTCYFSSSDAVFADRYDAEARYGDIASGEVDLEGGWRIYSSGPGLFLRIVVECLLGVRRVGDRLELDPVLDPRLSGLVAQVPVPDGSITVHYLVHGTGVGVTSVSVNGVEVEGARLDNPYRTGGLAIDRALAPAGSILRVSVGQ